MQQVGDLNRLMMKFLLLIANIFYAGARDLIDAPHIIFELCGI